VTEKFELLSSDYSTCRPHLVCLVNGLPVAAIEAKRPNSGNPEQVDEANTQTAHMVRDRGLSVIGDLNLVATDEKFQYSTEASGFFRTKSDGLRYRKLARRQIWVPF
jgi:type I site-specific restriction-modification system R (restriction) subunit